MSSTFLKKYKVIQKIGEGSFSEVLKCQDKVSGALYAAKRLKRTYLDTNEIWDCPEVSAMRKITRHPNVLYIIECLYDPLPGRMTLIFELMDMSLYDLMKARKGHTLMEHKVKLYLYQLLKGIDHLHKHGIFHRDIKPENVLIKGDSIKLADLGSIKYTNIPPYTDYISTRWYRSPECLLTTGFYGPKMDVWATGCVFYELLTLKPLFPGSNEIDQIARIHLILGTPHARLIAKFRRHKPRNCNFFFPCKKGQGLVSLLPHVTEAGREVLRLMLIYDPEYRSNVKKLLEHRYFNVLRGESPRVSMVSRRSITHTASTKDFEQWRNPMLVNQTISQKRRKSKPLNTCQSQIQRFSSSKIPRIATNPDSNSRRNLPCEFSSSRILNSIRNNMASNCENQVIRTETSNLKLPNIECSINNTTMRDSKSTVEKTASIKIDQIRMNYLNMRREKLSNRYYNQREECNSKIEFRRCSYNSLPQEIKSEHFPVLPTDSTYQSQYEYKKKLLKFYLEKEKRRISELKTKKSSVDIKSPFVKSPTKKIAKCEL